MEAGTGAPTVVLDAGAGSPTTTWAPVFPAMAGHCRVVAYHRAGYEPASPLTLGVQLGNLIALLGQVGNGPSVLVGHSWGGLLAQLAAWTEPSMVAGLVLVDPSHEQMWIDMPQEVLASITEAPRGSPRPSWEPRVKELFSEAADLAQSTARSASDDPLVQTMLIDAHLPYLATEQQILAFLLELPMIRAQRMPARK